MKIQGSESSGSASNLKKAVDSLIRFVGRDDLAYADFNETLLGEWVSRLIYTGYTSNTVAYYLKLVVSLYNKAAADGLVTNPHSFSGFQAKIKSMDTPWPNGAVYGNLFEKMQQIARLDVSAYPRRQLAKDILMFSICMGGLTLTEITCYKKDEYKGNNPVILEIVERNSKSRNKYLFPLRQSQTTQAKINTHISQMLCELFRCVNLEMPSVANDTPRHLWSALAMRVGISASEVAGCMAPFATSIPVCAFAEPSLVDADRKEAIQHRVTELLADNPVNWYAMQFRRGATFDMVKERIDHENIPVEELFYPMEEIISKIGKKMVTKNKPVISGVLFFRSRVTELGKLYSRIGDLAWGYRSTRDVRSSYAVISSDEIRRYQEAIGTFSQNTDIYPVGAIPLNEGDRLVIIGGLLSGYPATFIGETKTGKEPGKTVYRMLLPGDNKCEWAVENDPRLVKKITEEHYRTLLTTLHS